MGGVCRDNGLRSLQVLCIDRQHPVAHLLASRISHSTITRYFRPGNAMSSFTEEQARAYMHKLLAAMNQAGGSDLFIAAEFPPSMKSHGSMKPLTAQKLTPDLTRMLAHALMNETQREEFAKEMECNFAIAIPGV